MSQPIVVVDAFADRPFRGNPAAVCLLEAPRSEAWMKDVAAEMNLSETAFLIRTGDAYGLRWLTSTVEVDLCGHATLASAHILWEDGHADAGATIHFDTRSGRLSAVRRGDVISLDFPAKAALPGDPPPGLAEALGVDPVASTRNEFDALVEVATEAEVRAARPDFSALGKVAVRGVVLTSRASTPGYDFVSRFFAPASGVDEDPVTGSAHCFLGPYWAPKLGKAEFRAYQASARGGEVGVRVEGDRVHLEGRAVTVLRGVLI